MPKKAQTCCNFWYFLIFFANFVPYCIFFLIFVVVEFLAFFMQHIPILFVAVTKCNKQNIHLLQWLSVTNKTNLCHSDLVRQTILKKYPISLWLVTKELEKKPKTNILSNLNFTSAIKLLWGTLSIFGIVLCMPFFIFICQGFQFLVSSLFFWRKKCVVLHNLPYLLQNFHIKIFSSYIGSGGSVYVISVHNLHSLLVKLTWLQIFEPFQDH